MNIRSHLGVVGRLGKTVLVLLAIAMVGLASASVYVFYYVNPTSTIRASDITLVAGSDSGSGACPNYPCATVGISSTGDTAVVQLSMFKANGTFVPPPATYYSNLIKVVDANHAHTIQSVQVFGVASTRATDFGKVIVYYCTAQTDFNPDATLVTPGNCPGSYSITSASAGYFSLGISNQAIALGATHYIEVVVYAGNNALNVAGDTIKFNVAVQWF